MSPPLPPPPELSPLLRRAYAEAWDPERDLPWDTAVEAGALEVPEAVCLSTQLDAYRSMSPAQRTQLRRREMASHLSSLAFGEQRATTLAAETALVCPWPGGADTWFLGTVMADEGKHAAVLQRYLAQKLGGALAPAPSLGHVFEELSARRDYGLNLLVGQVVLEGAAASLLTSLLVGLKEPLLRALLRRVMIDEARHMGYAHLVGTPTFDAASATQRRAMEALLFEATYAGAASLLPEPAWAEAGLDPATCRRAAVAELERRGVLRFYTGVMVRQLRRRGFDSDTLAARLDRQLQERLCAGS